MRTLLGSFGIFAAIVSPAGAWASSTAVLERCKNEMTAPVMLPSQVLRDEFNIDIKNACPEQSSKDTTHKNCQNAANQLEKAAETWLKAHKESCKIKQKFADLEATKLQCTGAAANCSGKAAALQAEANKQNAAELNALRAMMSKVKELKKFALELAQGAVNIQNDAEQDAQANPRGTNGRHNKFLKVTNNEKAVEYFRRTGQTVQAGQQIIDALRGSDVSSGSGNQRPQSPLLREPVDLAAAAQRLQSDFTTRERELVASSNELNRQVATNTTKETSMSTLGNNASSLGQAASAAGGAGGAGSNAGSVGGDTSSYGVGDPVQTSSSNAMNESVTTVVQDADGTERYAQVPRSSLQGYNALSKGNSSAGTQAPNAAGIKNIDAVTQASPTGESGDITTSGSSRAPSSNLRNALRARLAGAAAAGSAGGMAEGGSASPLGEMPKAAEAAVTAAAAGADSKAEALAAATGSGDLGMTDFSLAGSETDSFVQGMVSQFSEDLGLGANRGLASVAQGAPEILEQDSASLFLRARATHERSLKRGLVINGLRSKL